MNTLQGQSYNPFDSISSDFNPFADPLAIQTPTVETPTHTVQTVAPTASVAVASESKPQTAKEKLLNDYKISKMDRVKTFLKTVARYTAAGAAGGGIVGFGTGVVGMIFTFNPTTVPVMSAIGTVMGGGIGLAGGIHTGLKQAKGLTVEKKVQDLMINARKRHTKAEKQLKKANSRIGTELNRLQGVFKGEFEIKMVNNQEDREVLATKVDVHIGALKLIKSRNASQNKQLKTLENMKSALDHQLKMVNKEAALAPARTQLENDLATLLNN
ncbi:hypothetical protein [Parendozoicomonas haliclonae]|uniref:Uncharacterized protein n=1 Tax=Parendozoicomonas haliclonae TaxID=1960125 RepID=A0A1X7AJS8_9GAMM|nr:hypothetical protein [Parendozoicomonas haliclonae]SMA47137.1 hypothetical protein EHSB41UT_02326 [Parendozoicomonas haliclonae]